MRLEDMDWRPGLLDGDARDYWVTARFGGGRFAIQRPVGINTRYPHDEYFIFHVEREEYDISKEVWNNLTALEAQCVVLELLGKSEVGDAA